jgi:Zn-dependent protease
MDSSLTVFFVVTVLWIFSVCLHEFGHAWVAYRGGDYTVAEKGYLTMNPLRYTDPVFSILMPVVFMALGGIGLPGGAVYIDRSLLRSREWSTAVSLAGPAMNIILIAIIGLAFKTGLIPSDSTRLVTISMAFVLQLQVYAVLLNLLPIPPLDGFQALAPWMRPETRERLYGMSNVGLFALFLALWYVKPFGQAFGGIVDSVCDFMGVDSYWAYLGFRAFRFWEH